MGHGPVLSQGIGGRPAPRGAQPIILHDGNAFQRRADGHLSDFHDARRGMDVHREMNGNRRVFVDRPDHSRVFAERGRPGFVAHPYAFHGHDFERRTYYFHGHAYDRFYRPYRYHNLPIAVYAPARYYPAGFYGWAYHPWRRPVVFAWGWGASPWVGYYGGYFAPAPMYSSAPDWLTDYMISQDLAAQYQTDQEAQTLAPPLVADGGTELTPEIKRQIAGEVQNQLALENTERELHDQDREIDPGSSGIARLISDGQPHVFVVGDSLDLVDADGNECAVSGGDVLSLNRPVAPDAQAADLQVLASKGGQECKKAATVTVSLADLQEMQNHMRETIDQGLQELAAKQGTNGLPSAPQAAASDTEYARLAPPPDPAGATEVSQQLQLADAAEKEVLNDAGASAQPASIALGQSPEEVIGTLGRPLRVQNSGIEKIFEYKDRKVTFQNGKVTDIE